jgi:anti-sigma B factor antagonist
MDTERLRIQVRPTAGGHLVELVGEIDIATSPTLQTALEAVPEGDVHLDFTGVPFLDSSGLHVLDRLRRTRDERGDRVILHGTQPPVRRVFEVTGLDELFELDGPGPPSRDP